MNLQTFLAGVPTPVLATGSVLVVLVLVFLVVFLVPGVLHWFRLRSIQQRIEKFETKPCSSAIPQLSSNKSVVLFPARFAIL